MTHIFELGGAHRGDRQSSEANWTKEINSKGADSEQLERVNLAREIASDWTLLTFEIDELLQRKLLMMVAADGYINRQ